jgi:hypothetical protein
MILSVRPHSVSLLARPSRCQATKRKAGHNLVCNQVVYVS